MPKLGFLLFMILIILLLIIILVSFSGNSNSSTKISEQDKGEPLSQIIDLELAAKDSILSNQSNKRYIQNKYKL